MLLQGTGRRTWDPGGCVRVVHDDHVELSFGWQTSPAANRACGCSIMLSKRVWPRGTLQGWWAPPSEIQGRAGAALVRRGSLSVLFVSLYFVPPGQLAHVRRQVAARILGWLGGLLALPKVRRAKVVIGMDFND